MGKHPCPYPRSHAGDDRRATGTDDDGGTDPTRSQLTPA